MAGFGLSCHSTIHQLLIRSVEPIFVETVDRKLAALGAGAFAVTTDGTLVVGLLRQIDHAIGASPGATGQALTLFATAYAVIAPITIRLLRSLSKRTILVGCLFAFSLTNAATAAAPSLAILLLVRSLAGVCAGVFFATAGATASEPVPPDRRGRALATVVAGGSLAAAVGVPLGTFLGGVVGWRATFSGVAVLSALIAVVLLAVIPERAANLRQVSRPSPHFAVVVAVLATTLLWATGSFTFFTYVGPILHRSLSVTTGLLAGFLFAYGIAGVVGALLGGWLTDRKGPLFTVGAALSIVVAALATLGYLVRVEARGALVVVTVVLAVYGFGTWAVNPPQQQRLLATGADGHLLLSLNASATYAGVALGSAFGGAVLAGSGASTVCWVASGLELAALGLAGAACWSSRADGRRRSR